MDDAAIPFVRRGRRTARYTAIANEIIDHPKLSPEARIVLIYLLSKPDDWRLRISDVRRVLGTDGRPCGRNKAYEVVKELKTSAYILAVEELRKGRFHRLTYYVFDEPVPSPEAFRAELRRRLPADDHGKCATNSADSPRPEFREMAAPPPQSRYAVIRDLKNRDLTKDRETLSTENPPPPPKRRDGGNRPEGGSGFSKFWDAWPDDTRPRERSLAAKLFAALSPDEQRMAAQFAQSFRATKGSAGGFAGMLPYLRRRLFEEFDGAPEVDGGHFIITPGRPEWRPWFDHLRAHHSANVVERQAAKGRFVTPTRWPPNAAETASCVPPDTASQASLSDAPSPHDDHAPNGAGR